MFKRAVNQPACRNHTKCVDTSLEHWKQFDHPSTHPFLDICQEVEIQKQDYETPPSKKQRVLDDEPLEIGQSTTITGSRGDEYTIKRHPDVNGVPRYWCTCPSRKYHGTKGDNSCKHIESLRQGKSEYTPRTMLSAQTSQSSSANTINTSAASKQLFDVALAEKYEPGKHNNLNGFVYMEKLDGFYAHFDVTSQTIYTRSGNKIHVPDWLIREMPALSVTGELYGGKGKFNEFQGLFNSNDVGNLKWNDAQFVIFDVVEECTKPMNFTERMGLLDNYTNSHVKTISINRFHSKNELDGFFNDIVKAGGEGVMLRKDVAYKKGRSSDLLKYKKVTTIDGKVVGYKDGTGRFANCVGSVIFETQSGKRFNCVPPDRINPPKEGTIVEIECFEITATGVPRHPRWGRVRTDIVF